MINLESFFADTVRDGWAPRHPCTDYQELATLELSTIRGVCLEPLLIEGDIVFADRTMRPECGDVVRFSLSKRYADTESENGGPPHGQTPSSAGDKRGGCGS